ncbi:PUA-like domain-containing protein, partial [Ochromonadaceae sp. CCMP2298]
RYKLMMRRACDSNRAFAYVPVSGGSVSLGDLALLAHVKEAEFFSDGRCMVECTLGRRHRIAEHYVEEGTQGLHFCALSPFSDAPPTPEESTRIADLTASADPLIVRLMASRSAEECGPRPRDPELLSLWLAGWLPLPGAEKARLLNTTSTVERMEACLPALRAAVGRGETGGLGARLMGTLGAMMAGAGARAA